MRVLHVIARMNTGGTARYLETLSKGLDEAGIENWIAIGEVQNGEIEDAGVSRLTVIRIPHLGRAIRPMSDFRAWRELGKTIAKFNPDVVHSHTFKAGLLARTLPWKGTRVHTYHGHIFNDGSLSGVRRIMVLCAERLLAHRTDLLISVGERVAMELRILGIGRKARWLSIPPGVDDCKLLSREEASKRLGVPPNGVKIGWLGRMVDVKDPMLALEVARKLPNVTFLLGGDGELLGEVTKLKSSNVVVLGWVPGLDVLAAVDVLLMTSRSEGMPYSAIEALIASIPVVAPDVGSLREIVTLPIHGVLTTRSPSDLATQVAGVIANLETFAVSSAERSESLVKFKSSRMIRDHAQAYRQLLFRNDAST